jgi:methylthioribose-1-phosphate isomerase
MISPGCSTSRFRLVTPPVTTTCTPTVEWRDDILFVLDQTLLPGRVEVRALRTVEDVVDAIARLVVRGAPAIGVCAAFGMVVAADDGVPVDQAAARIASARPTAVNLRWAVERVVRAAAGAEDARARMLAEAFAIQTEDEACCRRIGEYGRAEMAAVTRLLTHCNAGRLATCGIGTALAVAYAKAEAGEPVDVLATETRPLLQGARLTAWELTNAGIPVTLIADTAVGAALASGRVDAVVVGCDRVAANGDTANKIGTLQLAVLAREFSVPFYVAGPLSTFDPASPTGADIVVEERPADEVRGFSGAVTAPEGAAVWNPAFDVTPARLITAFVTDAGVLCPPFDASIRQALQ